MILQFFKKNHVNSLQCLLANKMNGAPVIRKYGRYSGKWLNQTLQIKFNADL